MALYRHPGFWLPVETYRDLVAMENIGMQEWLPGRNGRTDHMKVVILAGGMGSRISEESRYKPKPMIEIGDKPILWHIMNITLPLAFRTLSYAVDTGGI